MTATYDPKSFTGLTYFDTVKKFADGSDDPRKYLERCLETIAAREPAVKAWVILNEKGAREVADASVARWRAGKPLSVIDGMPVGIKDLIETKDMPTEMGCEAYKGNFPKRDSAVVRALRDAGAIVLGKAVTTELGGAHPGPTTNPFDPGRTPGGSSSGSAAAVGANMVPVAIGTQVGGSVIRPAAYCGNWALKPTFGGINRGERLTYSHSVVGTHANCAEDMWQVSMEMVLRAGGDSGCLGLMGPRGTPPAVKPQRLMLMQTGGWAGLDAASRSAFEKILEGVRAQGVEVVERDHSAHLDAFEQSIADAKALNDDICAFEMRWTFANLAEQFPTGLSLKARSKLGRGNKMTVEEYRKCLMAREYSRRCLADLAGVGDALISLSCPGPAPLADPDGPRPTGDAVFNHPSSMLGAPAVTVPLMAVGGMPVGVQIMGQWHQDARVTGIARWLAASVAPVSV